MFCDNVPMKLEKQNSSQANANPDLSTLPARLTPEQVASILGFKTHDIPILIRAKLLSPLGKPAQAAVKHFAKVTILELVGNVRWLTRAEKAIQDYWRSNNGKRRKHPPEETATDKDIEAGR